MKVGENKSLHFPVVVTSFEILMIDRPHLERHLWQVSKVEKSREEKGFERVWMRYHSSECYQFH